MIPPTPDSRLVAGMRFSVFADHSVAGISVMLRSASNIAQSVTAIPASPFWVLRGAELVYRTLPDNDDVQP